MTRRIMGKYNYLVTLTDDTGSNYKVPYSVNWDPEKVTMDEVMRACAADKSVESGKKLLPITIERVEDGTNR